MENDQYIIRKMQSHEYALLKEFTYQAVFQKDPDNPISKSVLDIPKIKAFYENFGKADDFAIVAVDSNGQIIGAVWSRIIYKPIKGYGNIDSETPELAISLYPECRKNGIGTYLMKNMIDLLADKGYKKTSLSVQKDNYAIKMYKKFGFELFADHGDECILVKNL